MTAPAALVEPIEDEDPVDGEEPIRLGPLLDEPNEATVARRVQELVDAQAGWHSWLCAVWGRNRQWRKGRHGVRIVEDTDTNTYDVRLPAGSSQMAPTPNNADRLIRRVVATLTVDPPKAEVMPMSGEDADRDAAEVSERILAMNAEDQLRALRVAGDVAGTYASAFIHTYVHPQGKRSPVTLEAHPAQTTLLNPETGEIDPGYALVDPASGIPGVPDQTVMKYLAADGVTLLNTPAGAQLRWEPKLCREVLTAKTVWFVPANASGIEETDALILGYVTTLGALRSQYPDAPIWDDDKRVEKLAEWRPKHAKRWLHPMMESALKSAVKDGQPLRTADGALSPDTPVFCYRMYHTVTGAYPEGAVVLTSGEELLYRAPWSVKIGEDDGNPGVWEALPIPVSQFRWRDDANDQSPYGLAGIEDIGPGEEVRAAQVAGLVEYLYRFNHPHVYLPVGTMIQPGMLAKRDGTPMPVNMDGSGKPIYESIPPFPGEAMQLWQLLGREQEQSVGLEDMPRLSSSTSGTHAQQMVEQMLVALANQVQNMGDCFTRQCRVELALTRAFLDVPSLTQTVAEGGSYKVKRWQAADLAGARDVRIRKGTMTMLTAERKQQMAMQDLEIGAKHGDPMAYATYKQATQGALHSLLGQQDDEQRLRVERQLSAYWEGPDEQTLSRQAEYEQTVLPQVQMAAQQAQMMGQQPPPAPPSPVAEAAQRVFAPLPVDGEPAAARVRWQALRDAVAQVRVAAFPPEWQTALFQAYDVARKAAGVQTVAEQAQAAQAAQQAETQAEAQKEQAKMQAETQQKAQLKQMDLSASLQKEQAKSAAAMQREALSSSLEDMAAPGAGALG